MSERLRTFWDEHDLSIVTAGILAGLFVGYVFSNQQTHWGTFFGNAIADWSGVLLMVLGSKYLMARGSKESEKKRVVDLRDDGFVKWLKEHSFEVFVVVTLAGWILLFNAQDVNSKWGQVVGNVVSEWTQALGLIQLTKGLREKGSAESK